jgi:hypothetical protein
VLGVTRRGAAYSPISGCMWPACPVPCVSACLCLRLPYASLCPLPLLNFRKFSSAHVSRFRLRACLWHVPAYSSHCVWPVALWCAVREPRCESRPCCCCALGAWASHRSAVSHSRISHCMSAVSHSRISHCIASHSHCRDARMLCTCTYTHVPHTRISRCLPLATKASNRFVFA